jgi:hypothetical protein
MLSASTIGKAEAASSEQAYLHGVHLNQNERLSFMITERARAPAGTFNLPKWAAEGRSYPR